MSSTHYTRLQKGSTHKGFDVIDSRELPDYKAQGVWLLHRRTGMEVFHMITDDTENLFAFAFRTPVENSQGIPHILEHSVLCGSKRYPLKSPFVRMANQSIKTFLNAMTFPDKTVYPASSQSRTDYFNLMAVYGDAVFFPILSEPTFAQEAHRIELDNEGRASVQGVVYNEMKGNYSSFETIAADASIMSLFDGTPYLFDSGGDPLHIPELTLRSLREFHLKLYHPGNCRLFLYGNIDTEDQLDFIEETLLAEFGSRPMFPVPTVPDAQSFSTPVRREYPAPLPASGSEKGCTVTVNWLTGKSFSVREYMETVYLAEVLLGHDGAPLMRALLESDLGEDIAPNTGAEAELRQLMMSAGLRGVEREQAEEVEKLIMGTLSELCSSGIPEDAIEAALMSVDFSHREVKRAGGPYSLVLMRRSLRGWLHGEGPYSCLRVQDAFEQIKTAVASDKDYTAKLITSRLIDNPHRSLAVVYPDPDYAGRRDRAEAKTAQALAEKLGEAQIREATEELNAYQRTEDPERLCALLPHIKPSELSPAADRIRTDFRRIAHEVPLFTNEEVTNGVIYIEFGFPADSLTPEELALAPLFSIALTNSGWGSLGWAEAASRTALHTGSFGASLFSSSPLEPGSTQAPKETVGRYWLFLRLKTVANHLKPALDLSLDCITKNGFQDPDRLHELALEFRNDMDASVIPAGHDYVCSRASALFSKAKTIDELWNGLSQVMQARSLADADPAELSKKFRQMLSKLRKAGLIVHITADASSLEPSIALINSFIADAELYAPLEQAAVDISALTELIQLGSGEGADEIIVLPTQVGFAAAALRASPPNTKEAAVEAVLAHLLSNTLLWEQIRTVGGAYGSFALSDSLERVFAFSTFRDPKPQRSLEVFDTAFKEILNHAADEAAVEKAVTGSYSRLIQPRAPGARGFTGFIRSIYGISEDMQEEKLHQILSVTAADIHKAAGRLHEYMTKCCKRAVICSKAEKSAGKIINLSL